MKKLLLIFPLLILGCAENLDKEITYKQEIDWIECKPSAVIRTKYFSGKINYILDLTVNDEKCDYRPIQSIYFQDKDGLFALSSYREKKKLLRILELQKKVLSITYKLYLDAQIKRDNLYSKLNSNLRSIS